MAFAVTNTFVGQTTLAAASLDQNFTDVVNLVNGGLTTSHLSTAAGITNAQLATSSYEFLAPFVIPSSVWVAASSSGVIGLIAVPGLSGTYTATYYSWATQDCGAQSGKFRLEWGWYQAGTWTNVTTIKSAVTLTAQSAVNDTAGMGQGSLSVSIAQDATNPRYIALLCDTTDNTAASGAASSICVTVKLKHALI